MTDSVSVKDNHINDEFEKAKKKNILFKDIEVEAIKELLLSEIDISKLKESLVADIKQTLLKEIDMSGIKETLTKDITFKKNVSDLENEGTGKESRVKIDDNKIEKEAEASKKLDLPAYKYKFTETLIEEHKELLSIYESIMHSAREKEFTMMPMMLSKFSKMCHSHFTEEEELYTFVKSLAGSRSEIEKKVATEFSVEMKNLSVSLFTTLNQSSFIPVTDNSVSGFIKEFGEIGTILQERIGREEKILFPMYENSRKVVDIC